MILDPVSRAMLSGTGARIEPVRPMIRVPRVSVVIPCYNYGRYLRRCVASVCDNQPGIDLEVIVIDDKSSDDSLEVARSIAREDPRVKVIGHAVNRGAIATYNEGLAAAAGEFVLLLSADDLATPGSLSRAAALLAAETSVGMVYGNAVHFRGDPPTCRTRGTVWLIWPGTEWLNARCRSGYNVVASPEVMMRSSMLREIGLYRADLPHAGDLEMWLRAAAVSDVGFLPGVDQAYYRQHDVNMHKHQFGSGTAKGHFIDLKQRWQAFEAVLGGAGKHPENGSALAQVARRTLAGHALEFANDAYIRGLHDYPVEDFERLAYEVYADAGQLRGARTLSRRKRRPVAARPSYLMWAASAASARLGEFRRRWRRRQIGI